MNCNKIVVIMGGWSHERDVSIRSGSVVFDSLENYRKRALIILANRRVILLEEGQSPNQTDFESQLTISFLEAFQQLESWGCQAALLALHGKGGEDGVIQGFLETLQIPHSHSDVRGSAVSMDKEISKYVYAANNIPTPAFVLLTAKDDIAKVAKKLNFPLVAKPNISGSSFGVFLVNSLAELQEKSSDFWQYDDCFLLEEYIQGPEYTCVVMDDGKLPRALPVTEIIPINSRFFDYQAKYLDNSTKEITPAEITAELSGNIQKLAVLSHQALKCSGVTRTDFMMSADKKIYVLETNTIPGMTAESLLPKAAVAAGMSFAELLDKLIKNIS